MTTPADIWITTIPQLRDRVSLQLVSRLIDSQITLAEAQVNQLQQVRKMVDEQLKNTK
jgi:lipopolysaccharide biosynthesis regulator YciM